MFFNTSVFVLAYVSVLVLSGFAGEYQYEKRFSVYASKSEAQKSQTNSPILIASNSPRQQLEVSYSSAFLTNEEPTKTEKADEEAIEIDPTSITSLSDEDTDSAEIEESDSEQPADSEASHSDESSQTNDSVQAKSKISSSAHEKAEKHDNKETSSTKLSVLKETVDEE
jgi:hypothetical protein